MKTFPCSGDLWEDYPKRTKGPRHLVAGQSFIGEHETFFHTIGSHVLWSIPIEDLVCSDRGKRIITGMSPEDAIRVGMEFTRYRSNEDRKELRS